MARSGPRGGAEAMLPGNTAANAQPTTIWGLYGYDAEGVWWEQSHFIIYRGRRKIDGQPVLIKLLKGDAESGRKCLQREFQITQELISDCVVKPLAFEQTERGPALIYADEAARPLEELAAKARLDIEVVLNIGARISRGCCSHPQGAPCSRQPKPDHYLVRCRQQTRSHIRFRQCRDVSRVETGKKFSGLR